MSEIEEIKERGSQAKTIIPHPDELTVEKWCEQNEIILQYLCDIQTLLSSLEKEKKRADKAESGWFVADKLEEFNRILDKKDERIRLAEERVKELEKSFNEQVEMRSNITVQKFDLELRLKDSEAKIQIYLQDIRNEQKLSNEIQERLKELNDAIKQAQEENPDEKHCTCVPLLKVRIKALETELIDRDTFLGYI